MKKILNLYIFQSKTPVGKVLWKLNHIFLDFIELVQDPRLAQSISHTDGHSVWVCVCLSQQPAILKAST